MCFSATASFVSGVVLAAIGIATLKKTTSKSQLLFASIPLLFAAQQITEGFLWLALEQPGYSHLKEPSMYLFLFFAQVVWPLWVPLSIFKLEPYGDRKALLKLLLWVGAGLSAYLCYCLLRYPVDASIIGRHVYYLQDYPPRISNIGGILYFIVTIGSPIISGVKRMLLLGLTILISYLVTVIFYEDYVVSVWCFFAAVISAMAYLIVKGLNAEQGMVYSRPRKW